MRRSQAEGYKKSLKMPNGQWEDVKRKRGDQTGDNSKPLGGYGYSV